MTEEFQRGWRPGVIGDVVRAHATYYAAEWGFGMAFEARVAGDMAAFLGRYDPERDLLLTADGAAGFLASVAIDGSDPALADGEAHLRWFIATDAARGRGVARRLLAASLTFAAARGFRSCYLDTFAGLDAARTLYEQHGFRLEHEADDMTWGVRVREQRFRTDLPATGGAP